MPEPTFNDVELLQQFCIRYVNKAVREHFNDINDIDDSNLTTTNSRHVAKLVSLHKDKDPITLTVARLLAFYFACGSFEAQPIYGIPVTTFHESNYLKPQVSLHFAEKVSEASTHNRKPVLALVSYRITDENLSMAEVNALAVKIKADFATPKLHFKKGRTKFSYRDKVKGYEFILTAFDETNAEKVIKAVLKLNNHAYDDERLTDTESRKNWNVTGTQTILGKTYKKPQRRPVADVYFSHAELKIDGLPEPIVLVDTTGRFAKALQKTY
ncbi:MAG: hypothetical protein KME40_32040 [Komarekiella atlantica HA4396-MV6]|jgi:hypothetical protein|nr:hypothetical protein [Komarekiella atlantica HA4396-MV6]